MSQFSKVCATTTDASLMHDDYDLLETDLELSYIWKGAGLGH